MARPRRPPVHGTVTQNRYLELRLQAQRIELLARDAVGADLEQLQTWFQRVEDTPVSLDRLRQTIDTWKKELKNAGYRQP